MHFIAKIKSIKLVPSLILLVLFLLSLGFANIVYAGDNHKGWGEHSDAKSVNALNALSNGFKESGDFKTSDSPNIGCAWVASDFAFCEIIEESGINPIVAYYVDMEESYRLYKENSDKSPRPVYIVLQPNEENIIKQYGVKKGAKTVDKNCSDTENKRLCEAETQYIDEKERPDRPTIYIDINQSIVSGTLGLGDSAKEIYFTNLENADDESGDNQCSLMSFKYSNQDNCKDIGAQSRDNGTEEFNFSQVDDTPDFKAEIQAAAETLNINGESKGCLDSGNLAKYVMCPLNNAAKGIMTFFIGDSEKTNADGKRQKGLLTSLLEVNSLDLVQYGVDEGGDKTDSVRYTDIGNFMNNLIKISAVFYILVFIIIILLNIFGLEAYSVKKILPRLLFAVFLTFLSPFIMQVAIDVTNVLGANVPAQLYQLLERDNSCDFSKEKSVGNSPPGSDQPESMAECMVRNSTSNFVNNNASTNLLGTAVSGIAVVILVLILLIIAIITMAMSTASLFARVLIIFICIMGAPIGFLFMVLPNTNGLFKKWYTTLFNNLMLYPIITGFLTLTVIIQKLLVSNRTSTIITMIIPFLAYAMIPKIIKKFSNGVGLGKIAGGLGAAGLALGLGKKAVKGDAFQSRAGKLMTSDSAIARKFGAAGAIVSGKLPTAKNRTAMIGKATENIGNRAQRKAKLDLAIDEYKYQRDNMDSILEQERLSAAQKRAEGRINQNQSRVFANAFANPVGQAARTPHDRVTLILEGFDPGGDGRNLSSAEHAAAIKALLDAGEFAVAEQYLARLFAYDNQDGTNRAKETLADMQLHYRDTLNTSSVLRTVAENPDEVGVMTVQDPDNNANMVNMLTIDSGQGPEIILNTKVFEQNLGRMRPEDIVNNVSSLTEAMRFDPDILDHLDADAIEALLNSDVLRGKLRPDFIAALQKSLASQRPIPVAPTMRINPGQQGTATITPPTPIPVNNVAGSNRGQSIPQASIDASVDVFTRTLQTAAPGVSDDQRLADAYTATYTAARNSGSKKHQAHTMAMSLALRARADVIRAQQPNITDAQLETELRDFADQHLTAAGPEPLKGLKGQKSDRVLGQAVARAVYHDRP